MRTDFSKSKYKISILEGTPLKIWKKVRGFNDKEDAYKCWEHLNKERVKAQFKLQYRNKTIEQTP
jgi:hypothetical protein